MDAWAEIARRSGAAGVLTLRRRGVGEILFQVKNALTEAELQGAAQALGLEEGGLALIVAAPAKVAATTLGTLRLELAKAYKLIPPGKHAFSLGHRVSSPRMGGGGRPLVRHPSPVHTSPDPRDLDKLESDPGAVRSRAYDVVLDGIELGGWLDPYSRHGPPEPHLQDPGHQRRGGSRSLRLLPSKPCATALRPTAASPWGSTAW